MKTKILIAQRNSGWGDNLLNYANAWLWAKNNNARLKIVSYDSFYLRNKNQNAFNYYFDIPNTVEGVRIITKQDKFVLAFTLRFIFRIVYKLEKLGLLKIDDYIKLTNNIYLLLACKGPNPDVKPFYDSLRLKSHMQSKIEKFVDENFEGNKILGLHVRSYPRHLIFSNHTKYWLDEMSSLNHVCNSVRKVQAKGHQTDNQIIFLCTDSVKVEHFITNHFKKVVIYNAKMARKTTVGERHYELGVEEAETTLIEMFLLAKCDMLIRYTGSWFSHYASLYVDDVVTIPPPPKET